MNSVSNFHSRLLSAKWANFLKVIPYYLDNFRSVNEFLLLDKTKTMFPIEILN